MSGEGNQSKANWGEIWFSVLPQQVRFARLWTYINAPIGFTNSHWRLWYRSPGRTRRCQHRLRWQWISGRLLFVILGAFHEFSNKLVFLGVTSLRQTKLSIMLFQDIREVSCTRAREGRWESMNVADLRWYLLLFIVNMMRDSSHT